MPVDFNEEPYATLHPADQALPRRGFIDYDRGVLKMKHHEGDVEVYMYWDDPGMYLNAYGSPVAEKFAEQCGFDIVRFGRARKRKTMMHAAQARIEEELQKTEGVRETIDERGGYRIVGIGLERYLIEDLDGNVLTPSAVSLEMARTILDDVVPPAGSDEKSPEKEPVAPQPPKIVQASSKK